MAISTLLFRMSDVCPLLFNLAPEGSQVRHKTVSGQLKTKEKCGRSILCSYCLGLGKLYLKRSFMMGYTESSLCLIYEQHWKALKNTYNLLSVRGIKRQKVLQGRERVGWTVQWRHCMSNRSKSCTVSEHHNVQIALGLDMNWIVTLLQDRSIRMICSKSVAIDVRC